MLRVYLTLFLPLICSILLQAQTPKFRLDSIPAKDLMWLKDCLFVQTEDLGEGVFLDFRGKKTVEGTYKLLLFGSQRLDGNNLYPVYKIEGKQKIYGVVNIALKKFFPFDFDDIISYGNPQILILKTQKGLEYFTASGNHWAAHKTAYWSDKLVDSSWIWLDFKLFNTHGKQISTIRAENIQFFGKYALGMREDTVLKPKDVFMPKQKQFFTFYDVKGEIKPKYAYQSVKILGENVLLINNDIEIHFLLDKNLNLVKKIKGGKIVGFGDYGFPKNKALIINTISREKYQFGAIDEHLKVLVKPTLKYMLKKECEYDEFRLWSASAVDYNYYPSYSRFSDEYDFQRELIYNCRKNKKIAKEIFITTQETYKKRSNLEYFSVHTDVRTQTLIDIATNKAILSFPDSIYSDPFSSRKTYDEKKGVPNKCLFITMQNKKDTSFSIFYLNGKIKTTKDKFYQEWINFDARVYHQRYEGKTYLTVMDTEKEYVFSGSAYTPDTIDDSVPKAIAKQIETDYQKQDWIQLYDWQDRKISETKYKTMQQIGKRHTALSYDNVIFALTETKLDIYTFEK